MSGVRTNPDWFGKRRSYGGIVTEDVGEGAARLFSPVTWDRRGDVLWMDGFENGFNKWSYTNTTGTTTYAIDNTRCRNGGFSLHVSQPGAVNEVSTLSHYFSSLFGNAIGVELHLAQDVVGERFEVHLWGGNGTLFYEGAVRLHLDNNVIEYGSSVGTWIQIGTFNLASIPIDRFIPMKLVVDFDNLMYKRLIWNMTEIDLSGIPIPSTSIATEPYMLLNMIFRNDSGEVKDYWVDDVIITQNEP